MKPQTIVARAVKAHDALWHKCNRALIDQAHKVLDADPTASEFCCAMGTMNFSVHFDYLDDGSSTRVYSPAGEFDDLPQPHEMETVTPELQILIGIIDDFVDMFGPTFGPVRFKRDHVEIYDW